jgi:hypothetical protein
MTFQNTPAAANFSPVPQPPTIGSLPAPSDLSTDETNAYELMNDSMREKVLQMRDCIISDTRNLLQSRYILGSYVLEITKNPDVYGALADIQLASFFGESRKTVYAEARRLRERYEPELFEQIVNAVNPENGFRVSYKHLTLLLQVNDVTKADQLLQKVMTDGLSTKETAALLKQKREQSGGKPRRPKPTGFSGVLAQMNAYADDWYRQYSEVWHEGQEVRNAFFALADDKLTEDLAEQVREAKQKAEQGAEAQYRLAQELDEALRKVEATVNARKGVVGQPKLPPVLPDEDEDDQLVEDVESVAL